MISPSPRPFRSGCHNVFPHLCLLAVWATLLLPRLAAQGLIEPDSRWLYPHFLGFRPADTQAVDVNPPRFSWPYRPGIRGNTHDPIRLFRFQVAEEETFTAPLVDVTVDYNFYNQLAPFPAGTWYWRVGYDHNANGTVDEWSDVRSFTVTGAVPVWDRSGHSNAFNALAAVTGGDRPRFGPVNGDWNAFRTFLQSTSRGQSWLAQLRTQANRVVGAAGSPGFSWYLDPDNHFPPTDHDGGPLDTDGAVDEKITFNTGSGTAVWRSNDFGRMGHRLITVAFAYKVTGDPNYAGAKDLLLRLAEFPHTANNRSLSWPEFHGATTKQTTALTEYFALLYDWYYDDLTPAERELLRDRVSHRVRQVFLEGRSWRDQNGVYNNGVGLRSDSHHYQNFYWAMPGLLILAGEDAATDAAMEAETLLPLTLDFLTGVTAGGLYGPDDGAINEGVGYGGEKQGTMLRTALMAEMLLNLEQQHNPFLTGYQEWFSQVLFDGYRRSPFGDQWSFNSAESVLQNMQALTLLTGNPRAKTRWTAEAAAQGDKLEDHAFSRPWTLMLAYQQKNANTQVTPEPEAATALFPESGWVMVGSQPPTTRALADTGPRMIFQSRPRGGLSHSFRAENSFSWHAFGEPLAAGGGSRRYPDPFSRHTMSHNSMLINGRGQEWINPNWPAKPYVGRILAYEEGDLPNGGSYVHWVGDASNAYRTLIGAGLKRWHRHVLFIDESYFVVYDDLEMNEGADPAVFSWLMQVDRPPPANVNVSGNEFNWIQNDVSARVVFSRDAADLDIIHQAGTGAVIDPTYPSGSGWAPDLTGNHVFVNPITGENMLPAVIAEFDGTDGSGSFAGSNRYYFSESEYAESQRTQNILWVQNAEPATRWQLMTALLAWPTAESAPQVTRLGNHRMLISKNGTGRTISFDPTQPGDYTVNLNDYRVHAGEDIPEKPTLAVRRSAATVRENSGQTPAFTLERSENFGVPVTVNFTLTGTAVQGVDYLASVTGSVHFPAETSEAVITLDILDNPLLQPDRTITLTLEPDAAYNIDQASATITILDDEALSHALISEALEPGGTRTVELTLANPHDTPRTFTLSKLAAESGYSWNSSSNHTGQSLVPEFSWYDLATSPTANSPSGYSDPGASYGVVQPVQIPIGFDFPFFGKTKTHLTIHVNGFLYFGDGTVLTDDSNTAVNVPLPAGKIPYDAIFPLWSNLRTQVAQGGGIFWEKINDNTLIVQWNKVGMIGQGIANTLTFQAVLRSDGSITFRYRDFKFGESAIPYTVGFQDHAGSQALQIAHNPESGGGTFIPKGENVNFAVHAWAPVQFVDIDPETVPLQPGESISITVTLDAALLPDGQYTDTLTVTDTHDGSTRQIPVLMTVAENPPPAAPANLTATRISSSRIDLAWTNRSTNETGLRIERRVSPGGEFTAIATLPTGTAAFSDTTVSSADTVRYVYRVIALNAHGESASNTAAAGNEPATPDAVQGTPMPFNEIELTWSHSGPETARFFVERRPTGSGEWTVIGLVPVGALSYRDAVGTLGTFEYRITAFDADLTGPPSAPVTVTLEDMPFPPEAPDQIVVVPLSPTDLRLSWDPPENAQLQYIERGTDGPGGPWTPQVYLPANANTFTDTGLTPGTTYFYRIWASNTVGDGARTAAQGTTPTALPGIHLDMPDSVALGDGEFTITVSRSGTTGDQPVRLIPDNDRLILPRYVTIPDGQASLAVPVTLNTGSSHSSTLVTAFAPAALIGESFCGPTDTDLAGQETGWGWANAWQLGGTSPILKAPALTFTKNGTLGQADTRFARLNGSSTNAFRAFPEKLSTGSIWVSTLLYRDDSSTGTQLIVRQNPGGGSWARIRYTGGTDYWMLEAGENTAQLLGSNPRPSTFFLVMEFDFDSRKVRAWLNPDVNGAAPTHELATATVDMQETLDGISRLDIIGHSNRDGFDEIRVARSFSDLYSGVETARAIRVEDDTAAPLLSPSSSWRFHQFGTTASTQATDWMADPDADGVPNLLEYALGGDPNTPNTIPLLESGLADINGQTYWTVQIDRNPDAHDILFDFETSDDLIDWHGGPGHIEILEDAPGHIRVRSTAPLSESPIRFIRYRVILTAP
jgi:hypothetical protein